MARVDQLAVTRLSPVLGAEIRGVDLTGPLSPSVVAQIRQTWLDHSVVFFPEQHLSPAELVKFASQFGEVTDGHPIEPVMAEHPEVMPVDSAKDRVDFWHSDVTFMSRPPMASVLCAVILPEVGGDTMWADTAASYAALEPGLRTLCDGLSAWHHDEAYAARVASGQPIEWDGRQLERLDPVLHPVVRRHPETGRPHLFVNPKFTLALADFAPRQSQALLDLLYDQMTQPEFLVRYRWSAGTVAFWDNRATMHYALFDYGEQRRLMHRVTLRGDTPQGVAVPSSACASGAGTT